MSIWNKITSTVMPSGDDNSTAVNGGGSIRLTGSCVLPHALKLPVFQWLDTPHDKGKKDERRKRVVLASASPRRRELLEMSGLKPEIVPSSFAEDLPHSAYAPSLAEYPVATAGEKAMEVYERLVAQDIDDPPDLVISADTVVINPPQTTPSSSHQPTAAAHASGPSAPLSIGHAPSRILEKPIDKEEHGRMLGDLNGKTCEVVTGVCVVYPTIAQPGFQMRSISISTLVHFNDNPPEVLSAYIAHGEGHDRAGGFAAQGLGGVLVKGIEGDWNNVVGFPVWAFWRWMNELWEEGVFED